LGVDKPKGARGEKIICGSGSHGGPLFGPPIFLTMMKNFVGSKRGAGVAQWLISLMPAHRVFVDAFLGPGHILQTTRPAELNIGIEKDSATIADYLRRYAQTEPAIRSAAAAIVKGDCMTMLQAFKVESDWLIYADPPYLSRSCSRRYYREEMMTESDHDRLLSVLSILPAKVMISGYQSDLYSIRLASWRTSSFWTVNRRGKRVQEFCWMNFQPPALLHDTRFVGNDFTDRQRIKRKAERWKNKFQSMRAYERQAVLESILTVRDPINGNI
jgi:hypothetical protein